MTKTHLTQLLNSTTASVKVEKENKMNANYKSRIIANWLCRGFSAVFILTFITSVLAQTPTLRANGKIAFTSDRDGNPEIYLMNPDGTNQTRLTNNSIVDDHAMWSPDGNKLAFVSQRAAGGFAIFQMNMDGSNRVEITPLSNYVNRVPDGVVGFSMSWSPDGRKITYQDGIGGPFPGYQDIFVIDLDTQIRRNLTNDGSGSGFCGLCDYHPAWSPDGSTILYSSPRFNGVCASLYAMNPDGTNRRLLSGNHCPAYSPSWSPDGMKIVFVNLNGEFVESELRIANSDGTDVRIFDGGYPDINNRDYPRWSPDGQKIAFNMTNSQDIEIFVKNIDGTGYAQLTNTPAGLNYRPSWQALIPAGGPNPIDSPDFFVRQHYRDFLNREPDAPGQAHWTNEITMCSDPANRAPGETEAQCVDRKRTNTSGAFYLSNEFQNSANFLIRVNWGSLGKDRAIGRKCIVGQHSALDAVCRPLYSDYIADMAKLTQGIVVNDQLDPNAINTNKRNFVNEFVTRPDFLAAYPNNMMADAYVDKLSQTTGIALTAQERQDLITKAQTESRAAVLFDMVDGTITIAGGQLVFNTRYGRAFYDQEFNPAFVFVQYLSYLRRNPDQAGYDHWLGKLNFYGNFGDAQMVRSFLVSDEYRTRFGMP